MTNSFATKFTQLSTHIKMPWFSLSIAFLVFSAHKSIAEASVWKISANGNELYLGGTVHMLLKEDHPLPVEYDQAYLNAVEVYLETDLQQANSPGTQSIIMQAMTNNDGRTLSSMLEKPVYAKLSDYLNSRGMSISLFETFKASGVSLTLSVLELQRIGMDPSLGVDVTFQEKAIQDQKRLSSLETIEEQLAFIQKMNEADPNKIIEYTLRDMQNIEDDLEKLKTAWRQGNTDALEALGLKEMRNEFPNVYNALIKTRNAAWLKKIKAMLETADIEFVLVGALHLVGEDGLLRSLARSGYTVEKL